MSTRFQRRLQGILVVGFVAFTGLVAMEHVRTIRIVRDVSVPLVAKLADLEKRKAVLESQVELTELSHAVQVRSLGEHLDAYVLPAETQFDRLLTVFDLLRDSLRSQHLLSTMSDIAIGDSVSMGDGMQARLLSTTFTVHEEGMERIALLVDLAGLITVGDALTDEEVALLFQGTESENPAGIVALEQFLSTNLLSFARDERTYVEQLKRSFTSPLFERTLRSVLDHSRLRDAEKLFADSFGEHLQQQKLWPMQFVTVQSIRTKKGGAAQWYTMDVELLVWERGR